MAKVCEVSINFLIPPFISLYLFFPLNHSTKRKKFIKEKVSVKLRIRGQFYNTFYSRNLRIFAMRQIICPWQAYPSEAPFKCSTLGQVPGISCKHKTSLERIARDKFFSLLQKIVNYGCNFLQDRPHGWYSQNFLRYCCNQF